MVRGRRLAVIMAHIFARDEVEAAWRAIGAAGDAGDWDLWADLHSIDCEWHECNYGIHHND